jgi:hypothetical protein
MPLTRVNTWAGVCSRCCGDDAFGYPADYQWLFPVKNRDKEKTGTDLFLVQEMVQK